MNCACVSGTRVLQLELSDAEDSFREQLNALDDWTSTGAGQWEVRIGGPSRFQKVDDVVRFLEAFTDAELLDAAMSHWKDVNRGSCCGSVGGDNAGTTDRACERLRLLEFAARTDTPLTKLLREGRLETRFQPVVLADGETVWGYECLMRGIDEEGNLITPDKLLSWAKAENLLSMLDRVCRETHLRNAAAKVPTDKVILINFIPTAIYEPAFCLQSTMKVVRKMNLQPHQIVFEVVESEHVRDTDHLCKILDYYRESGFRTALDDLGAGFSGLNMLANLRPDMLKLDLELVQGAAKHFAHKSIVQGLVNIAKDCGQTVLAEGIETEADFQLMKELGVDLFQGYYFGKPEVDPVETPARLAVPTTTDC